MAELGERVASLEAYQRAMHSRLEKMEKTLDSIAADIQKAKGAGRLVLGVAVVVGAITGSFLQWLLR